MGCIRLQRTTDAKPGERTKPLERRDLVALFEADLKVMTEAMLKTTASA